MQVTGTDEPIRVFGPDSSLTAAMKNAPGVKKAKKFFEQKNIEVTSAENLQSVTNFRAGFGLRGLWNAGSDLTQQFVGDYRVDMFPDVDGNVTIVLTNTTSMTSFSYHQLPSWERSTFAPFGNMTQYYWWTEPYPFQ